MTELRGRLRAAADRLRALPAHPLVSQAWGFGEYLVQRIQADQCAKSAGMLAYVTLLAIVPLMTIGFSVLAAFPVFEGVTDRLREAMVDYLVPAASDAIDEHLENFMGRAAELTAVGIAGLTVTALLLLNTIERVLNEIWRVERPRPTLQRFMVYWTVLTMGPLLLGVSVASTSYMGTVSLGPLEPPSDLIAQLLNLAPFVVQAVVFTLLYSLVPHRSVPVHHAVIGGVVASGLFELAKGGFAAFIARAPTYEVIYGALAALPIFLVWLYISWLVILIGAEVTQALRGYRWRTGGHLARDRWALVLAVHILGHLYQAQRRGEGVTFAELLEQEPEAGEPGLAEALEALRRHHVIERSVDGAWLLARDPSTFKLAELHRMLAYPLPPAAGLESGVAWDRRLAERLRRVEERWEQSFDLPLSALLEPTAEEAADAGRPAARAEVA
ncbi:MAG: virulence factor BrkB family protein [Halorhodospira halophila]|uniref:virulence factor BrkB family protein n=1 Tax=Halorhodospira halophila TaxID=1053 RepID=UPI0026E9C0BE|nr:virulence factor BrkB family protein [Halorhodospira halophila]MCC3751439.1 virulence factor BrkB family protein [Halorhodospira halophila]